MGRVPKPGSSDRKVKRRQATLGELKKVVRLASAPISLGDEELGRLVGALRVADAPPAELLNSLRQLASYVVKLEMMQRHPALVRAVRALRKHGDAQVAGQAARLFAKWQAENGVDAGSRRRSSSGGGRSSSGGGGSASGMRTPPGVRHVPQMQLRKPQLRLVACAETPGAHSSGPRHQHQQQQQRAAPPPTPPLDAFQRELCDAVAQGSEPAPSVTALLREIAARGGWQAPAGEVLEAVRRSASLRAAIRAGFLSAFQLSQLKSAAELVDAAEDVMAM